MLKKKIRAVPRDNSFYELDLPFENGSHFYTEEQLKRMIYLYNLDQNKDN